MATLSLIKRLAEANMCTFCWLNLMTKALILTSYSLRSLEIVSVNKSLKDWNGVLNNNQVWLKLIFKKNDCTLKPRPFLVPIKRNHEIKSTQVQQITRLLTLYTLKSVRIFSILFFIHFLRCWQGEFVYQSKASFIGNHFLYFHDLNMWLTGDIVGRNLMLVTLRG